MTRRARTGRRGEIGVAAGSWVVAILLLSAAAWSDAASPSAGKADAATVTRDSLRCRRHPALGACYDAIRWNPSDPALLVALGDALAAARRPADAIRNYRRAAALDPAMQGIAAKISAAEAKLPSKRAARGSRADAVSGDGTMAKRYSNEAPEAQSH